MDAKTVTSPQTHNWELLAQLACIGQDSTIEQDAATLVNHIATLLQHYLSCSWGVVAAIQYGHVVARASWGMHRDGDDESADSADSVEPLKSAEFSMTAPPTEAVTGETEERSAGQSAGQSVERSLEQSERSLEQSERSLPTAKRPCRFPLIVGQDEVGYLILPCEHLSAAAKESYFYHALATQIGMVLLVHRHQQEPSQVYYPFSPPPTEKYSTSDAGSGVGSDAESDAGISREPASHKIKENDPHLPHRPHHPHHDDETRRTETPEHKNYLGLLHRVSAAAASTLDNQQIYTIAVEAMACAVHGDAAWLAIYDRGRGTAKLLAKYAHSPERVFEPFPLLENPVVDWLDRHQRALFSKDAQHDPLLIRFQDCLRTQNVRSTLMVPLMVGGKVLGIVQIEFATHQSHLNTHELEQCQIIAYQIARVIENARLVTQATATANALQTKVGELSTLLEAAHLLGSLLQPDEVLNSLMDLVSRQLGVSSVALWTIGKDGMLSPSSMYGVPEEFFSEVRVPVGAGLTGKVAEDGLPLIVNNVQKDDRSFFPEFNKQHNLVSFSGVPVFYRERIIGVLSVMTNEEHEFTGDEVMLLIGLASQAAIALENARLFQEREQRIAELTIINNIAAAVNASLELDEVLLMLHRGISEVLDTTYSFIGLYEINAADQTPVIQKRVVSDGGTVALSSMMVGLDGKGLSDYVVLEGKSLLLQTMKSIMEFRQQRSGKDILLSPTSRLSTEPESWLGVPIVHGREILGIINVQSNIPFAYTEDDKRFLSTVAGQAAVAIANARLFSDRDRRLREITALKDIGTAISSTLDLQAVLERLHHELAQVVDVSTSLIGLYDEHTGMLSYPICYDNGQRLHIDPSPLGNSSSGWAIRNRQPLLLHSAAQCEQMGINGFGFSVFDVRSAQSGIRHPRSSKLESFLVTPIISNDSVIGVINIQSYQPNGFDDDHLRFLIAVANQIAVTIANVRLFQEHERRIEELATFNEIGQALSATVRLEDLPKLIYDQASRLLNTANFYIALIKQETREICFPIFYIQGEKIDLHNTCVKSEGKIKAARQANSAGYYLLTVLLTRQVIHKREPVLLQGNDLQQGGWDTEIIELSEEIGQIDTDFNHPRSWLGVPMIASNKVVGVMGIQDYSHNQAYTSYDIHLLSTIASWASIALENGRLFEEIRNLAANLECRVGERTAELEQANEQLVQEKEYLETLHSITLELASSLDLREIINRTLKIASTNLNVSRGSIMMQEMESTQIVCRAVLQEQGVVHSADYPISFGSGNGDGLVGWVIQHQQAVRIDDVRADNRWVVEAGRADEVRSVVAAPLMTSESTIGVIIFTSPEVGYFTESQVRFLATIANEVAIALHKAQLYDYINEIALRLSELLDRQKEENSKSHAILQSLTEGVIVLDNENKITLVNWAAEHILSITGKELLMHPLEMLADYGDTEYRKKRSSKLYNNLQESLKRVAQQEKPHTTSFGFDDPSQTVAMSVAPVIEKNDRNYGNVAVFRDITREIELDQAKKDFVSKVSHEFRTPITSIRGYADVLRLGSSGPVNDIQKEYLQVIKKNADQLTDLIEELLELSRIESNRVSLEFKEVDVREIIDGVVAVMAMEVKNNRQHVNIDIQEDLPTIIADKRRLHQIMLNLYSNAVKYTYPEGTITVRAFITPSDMLQVDVEDTGVGLDQAQMKNLFSPFYRADNPLRDKVSGSGLGLSITKSLVEQHGGALWVESEVNKGSTFSFIVPLEQQIKEEQGQDQNQDQDQNQRAKSKAKSRI